MLITLDATHKIRSGADVDRFISAQIPDPIAQPRLFELVKKHMVHGPICGPSCRKPNGKCDKGFPKDFKERSSIDDEVRCGQ